MRSQPDKQDKGATHSLAALLASRYWHTAEAERVLEAWRQSGQSGAAFARRHGLSVRRLLRWRDRLQPSPAPVFHPVRVVQAGEPIGTPGTAALELELRGGRRIRVHRGFDPELLEVLVRTVEGWGC